ncbi:MAG: bifunctional UDP-3-O-[3-hydroxymyristoyl] N-acetylglucosamine deacetylase/3-hydroxyacyl-ACP dehydratase [Salinivirgaceae bacterium]|nr:bifunctional UDP-3-O-[3-hydroxymyristoyl] N-acetylglucosamine deacetylase/3-hydroxyacyl-ACP dehydratase [Salinivirgaceae bacterium]MDD4748217.1 bifunctional UDP-3-O-[3-hydroxymyristoyl] N-acetylglucosamine deacetylase/3-hydroxyacyl-ACP dehydratase [Salinivirgaceae bacterium]MDY0279630.1 bifunctional UDP-3-O-[3-hydroxymyristoyl] N-acetylglucosamine deacetylase/3-hydroxyacyl-ACP dehydratase [Salinivirgaceae bacterium]
MTKKQTTLKNSFTLEGAGLHTGTVCKVCVQPAPENYGYKFVLMDIEGQPELPALADFVTNTERGTTLQRGENKMMTMEHLLAALYGMQVDNARIEITGPEVPILDGSSLPWVTAINKAGIEEQSANIEYYYVNETIEYTVPEKGIEIRIEPADEFSIDVMIDYNSKVLGNQYARLTSFEKFETEIAPCRTFVFLHELEMLHKNNLIKGGDWDNAIVIVEHAVSNDQIQHLASLFNKPVIEVKPEGILNNLELRFHNEPARHKLLDVIGDLALVGRQIKGKVTAVCPGHMSNTAMAKIVRKKIKDLKNSPQPPKFDPLKEPIYDINRIKQTLPHRPPFLLVDKIVDISDTHVVGVKNITMNEPFFVGHFPDEPVMPGVLQIEAMAQAGGILALSTVPDPETYTTYFLKIDGVKFKKKVVPGDTLVFHLVLDEPIRRGIVVMTGHAFVGNTLVMEAHMTAQIVKVK